MGRDVVLSIERLISSSPHYRSSDVPSVSGEQDLKPTSPRVLARGRGCIRFWGSAAATARWTSSSLYVRCSPISIDGLLLLPPRRQSHCKYVYLLSVVRSRMFSVASTRCHEFVSDHSASLDSYICDTYCWFFSYC